MIFSLNLTWEKRKINTHTKLQYSKFTISNHLTWYGYKERLDYWVLYFLTCLPQPPLSPPQLPIFFIRDVSDRTNSAPVSAPHIGTPKREVVGRPPISIGLDCNSIFITTLLYRVDQTKNVHVIKAKRIGGLLTSPLFGVPIWGAETGAEPKRLE